MKDTIPTTRIPGFYTGYDDTLKKLGLPRNRQKVLLVGQRLPVLVEPARFQGGTLNDCTSGGTYTGTLRKACIVQISTAAATDKFKWSKDGGLNWSTEEDLTGSAQTLEEGVQVTFAATTGHAVGDEWRFTAWPEPTTAELTPTQVYTDDDAATRFGFGSVAHRMALSALTASRDVPLYVCAEDDAGSSTKAAGSVTLSGPATAPGYVRLYIGPDAFEVGVSTADTAAELALLLQKELSKDSSIPVTVAVDATTPEKLNLEARNAGTLGNSIYVGYEITAPGVGATVVQPTGGATDPDLQDALDAVATERYHLIVSALNDQTSLGKLKTHLDTVSGPTEQKSATGWWGMNGAFTEATTLASAINGIRLRCGCLQYVGSKQRSLPHEVASALASVRASKEDPAMHFDGQEVTGLAAPEQADRLLRSQLETCLENGVTPLDVKDGGVVVTRLVTTHVDSATHLDINPIDCLDYVRDVMNAMYDARFRQRKKSERTKTDIKLNVYAELRKLEDAEIVQNVEEHKDMITVEDSPTDETRVEVSVPAEVIPGLHVVATTIYLL